MIPSPVPSHRHPIIKYLTLSKLRPEDHIFPILLTRRYTEGYPTNEYAIEGLRIEDLQRLADWLITLPKDLYEPVADLHRALERALINDRK